jgi:hypothetical protein
MTWTFEPNYDSYLPTTKECPVLFTLRALGILYTSLSEKSAFEY